MIKKGNLESTPNIVLTDNSKFGTFVNGTRVEGFQKLTAGDVLKFGTNPILYK